MLSRQHRHRHRLVVFTRENYFNCFRMQFWNGMPNYIFILFPRSRSRAHRYENEKIIDEQHTLASPYSIRYKLNRKLYSEASDTYRAQLEQLTFYSINYAGKIGNYYETNRMLKCVWAVSVCVCHVCNHQQSQTLVALQCQFARWTRLARRWLRCVRCVLRK